jgi:hypothetical protein
VGRHTTLKEIFLWRLFAFEQAYQARQRWDIHLKTTQQQSFGLGHESDCEKAIESSIGSFLEAIEVLEDNDAVVL